MVVFAMCSCYARTSCSVGMSSERGVYQASRCRA